MQSDQLKNFSRISVVGAGLAGTECSLQLAKRGFKVDLYEMRPNTMTPAHKTDQFAELVCSNSFGSLNPSSAPGQLKWEAEKMGSFVLRSAKSAQVPAGQALGIDRSLFSSMLTQMVRSNPNIRVVNQIVQSLQELPRPCVVATGPLTHESLAHDLAKHFDDQFLFFFDAIAPIIDADSIDLNKVWRADRYDKGSPDYLNCPLSKDEYFTFINQVKLARKIEPKDFEKIPYFESCMPIEALVERGDMTLAFGPMKPKGLKDPKTGREPFAVVQLRQENREGTCYNMVGFQTKMAYGEQVRVFRMIPGLENAEFLKLGSMHKNLFLHSPKLLNLDLSSKKDPWLFFAGQMTGVEGYFESTCTGILVSKFIADKIINVFEPPPRESAVGSILNAITESRDYFQPTNINFGLFPGISDIRDKKQKKEKQIEKARDAFEIWAQTFF